jgi:hypothetical protein
MEFPNKANPAVAKALEESDTDEIMRLVNFTLIHDMGRWKHHYPLHSFASIAPDALRFSHLEEAAQLRVGK